MRTLFVGLWLLCSLALCTGQNIPNHENQTLVPRLIRFSGQIKDATGTVGIRFTLHKSQDGNAALWEETQNVQLDSSGRYNVLLGATKADGIPMELFTSGEAQWLGVQVEGRPAQPRILLVSVPYALKAAEAETLGGHAATEFVTGETLNNVVQQQIQQSYFNTADTKGTVLNPAVTNAATTFADTNTTQVITVTQKGSGKGLVATTLGTAAVLGSANSSTGTTTGVQGQAASTNGVGVHGVASATSGPTVGVLGSAASPAGVAVSASENASSGATTGLRSTVFSQKGTAAVLQNKANGPLLSARVGTNNSEVMSIDGQGSVLVGNTSKGLRMRSTGAGNDLESFGAPLYVNYLTNQPTYLFNKVGIGTTVPQATLNLNVGDLAQSDALLVGSPTHGISISDQSGLRIDTYGSPLLLNSSSKGSVGIGTTTPEATLNLNVGGTASNDSLLLGNASSKGLQLRDNGTGVDLESIGVPLYVNFVTKQNVVSNPNGGQLFVGPGALGTGAWWAPLVVGSIHDAGDGSYTSAVFANDISVWGNFYAIGTKDFRIDHPSDPLNKYLVHAAMESSEVLNQYSGNVTLNEKGEARVDFPAWFSEINVDFRYQLTAIGAPGPNLYVAKKVHGNSFEIAGGTPGMEVSWQVTARRNDRYMKAHPFQVEREKPEKLRGRYSVPELYGVTAAENDAHK